MITTARDAAPPRASGHDASRLAFAEVDSAGLPTKLRIEQGWANALHPAQLSAALTEAYHAATQAHLEEWGADLQRQGWQYDARDFDHQVNEAPTPSESIFKAPASVGDPRSVEDLLGAVMQELDFSHELATQPPPPVRETAPTPGRVRVSIANATLESIHIDADWAAGKDAASINGELAAAVQTARISPSADASPAHSEDSARLDGLLGEVMQALHNHRMEK